MSSINDRTPDTDDVQPQKPSDDDSEGHIFLPDPGASRELARSREREMERAARERQRSKDARGR